MNVEINTSVCRKVKCENYIEIKGNCKLLMSECTGNNYSHMGYTHLGCIVPEECLYKNFHIIDKPNLGKGGFGGCGDCKYCPEEPK